MSCYTVLITSVGGAIVPSLIQHWEQHSRYTYRFVGVDMDVNATGQFFVHAFYPVASAESSDYVGLIKQICHRESVDFILPYSDEEAVVLQKNKNQFPNVGVLCAPYPIAEYSLDKYALLKHLGEQSVFVPTTYSVDCFSDLRALLEKMGENLLVVKPKSGRGSRGFRIVKKDVDEFVEVFQNKKEVYISHQRLLDIIESKEQNVTDLLFMQYLPGNDYNIDVLCNEGQVVHCVIHWRVKPNYGPVEVGEITHDEKIYQAVESIVTKAGYDGLINIEMAYDDEDSLGTPLVYEINPRASAAIILSERAGVPMLDDSVALEIGLKVDEVDLQKLTMRRIWTESFIANE